MDDMGKYLGALSESAAGTSKVDNMNAALVDKSSAFNAKLRNIHSEVMGATDPVGIATAVKGLSKIGRGTYQQLGLGEAYDDYAAEGITGVARGFTNRAIAGQMDNLLKQGQARLADPDSIPAGQSVDADTGLTAEESSKLDDMVAQSGKAPAEIADAAETTTGAAAAETGAGAAATTTIESASAEGALAKTAVASAADDWNPVGIITTIGLGLATLFAGIFGHKKEQMTRHVQSMTLNPSTQFGV